MRNTGAGFVVLSHHSLFTLDLLIYIEPISCNLVILTLLLPTPRSIAIDRVCWLVTYLVHSGGWFGGFVVRVS